MKYYTAEPYLPMSDIEEILKEIKEILGGNAFFTKGPRAKEFEDAFAAYVGAKYAIAVNSGTTALELALQSLNLSSDDEVIVPVQTFVSTASAVIVAGAKPVFAEIDSNFLIDIEDVKKKITIKTKAVILVHFMGLIHPKIDELRQLLKKEEIILIEDAAHAHGARYKNEFAGNIGDIACFSFYSTKIMTTAGEGGMVVTNNEIYAKYISSYRAIGINYEAKTEEYNLIGGNRRMNEIQAIVGLYQLKRLSSFVEHRVNINKIYKVEFDDLVNKNIMSFQQYSSEIIHPHWRFLVILEDSKINRYKLSEVVLRKGIKIDWPYQPLLHLQPVFRNLFKTKDGFLPFSERISENHFCLPTHLNISELDARYIAKEIKYALL